MECYDAVDLLRLIEAGNKGIHIPGYSDRTPGRVIHALRSKEPMFIPLIRAHHWRALVLYPEHKKAYLLDPMGRNNWKAIDDAITQTFHMENTGFQFQRKLRSLLWEMDPSWTVNTMTLTPQTDDAWTCGYWVTAACKSFLTHLELGENPDTLEERLKADFATYLSQPRSRLTRHHKLQDNSSRLAS
jgi:hypothetical protein